VLGPDILFAIAKAKPRSMDELSGIKGATGGHRARAIASSLLQAVAAGLADGGVLPDHERAMLERPRPPQAVLKARRSRESRLTSWRKAEAKRRGVDEQVILPGHCLQDLADLPDDSPVEAIATIPGIGAFRVDRDGSALALALAAPRAVSDAPDPEPPAGSVGP
jgi:ribonuclease D